ncbi:MAG: IS110 family transposase [Myxococcales bacterium]|nr:IS110 family transposase [Myxococcales bacterium]
MLRFRKAGQLFSYAGAVPSEHSSGGPRGQSRGGITKTGNGHLRHILVEAAWHDLKPPGFSAARRSKSRQPTRTSTARIHGGCRMSRPRKAG